MGSNTPTSLVAVIPTLGRPQALRSLVEAFAATTADYRILLVVDDQDFATWDVLPLKGHPEVMALAHTGTYPQKANAGIAATTEPLVLVGADDIVPHPGWLENAKALMSDTVGYVSTNDLGNGYVMEGSYATHPLVARWYCDLGPLYDEAYFHNGVDVDASLRAKQARAFAYAPDAVVEHCHPLHDKGEVDTTYLAGGMDEAKNATDRALLLERWGPELKVLGIGCV